jgi:hemolysin activation/secretion protein
MFGRGIMALDYQLKTKLLCNAMKPESLYCKLPHFVDAGAVWNVTDNPNNEFLPTQRFLLGAGVGLIWEPLPKLNLRLDYAPLFINLSDRGNNLQDDGFYFSFNYRL